MLAHPADAPALRPVLISALSAAALPIASAAADEPPAGGWIDAHAHIWTSDVARYPLAGGQPLEVLQPRDFTAQQLIDLGRPLGVERFVLIQHKPHHGLDNSYLLDAMAAHPGVFSGVACVAAEGPHPDDDMRRLARGGMRGFRIRPGEGGADRWRDSPGQLAMWSCAAETGLAICPLINPEHLDQVDEMCRRFPQTPVVIDHFARIGMEGPIQEADVARLAALARHPRVHVKVSAFYALGNKRPPHEELLPMIRRLCEAFGVRRLMWASDSPYQLNPPSSYDSSFALVRDRLDFLSAAERQELLRGTAERVYFGPVEL